jgi:glycosyltransferase involved in cell wall biosynthesis
MAISSPRRARPILVIGARMLTPDLDAGSLRMYHLLAILSDLSCQVTFIASFPSSWPPYTERLEKDSDRLREMGIEVPSGSVVRSVEDYLQQSGRSYDAVLLGGEYVAAKHLASVRHYAPQAITLFDTGDLHYVRHYREAKITGNVRALKRALQTKRRELKAAKEADYTLVVSPVEQAILERDCPGVRVHVISSIHEVYGAARPFSGREGMLFVGSFQHTPNLDAVGYFVEEIFPLIKEEIDSARAYIIGGDPPDFIQALDSDDVIVTGYVPDLAPYFDNCLLSVAPLRFGAGVKGKVLTSLSHGVPVVGTSVAVEGLFLSDGENVLVADDPAGFSKAVVALYQDATLWNRLSKNGLDILSQHFSFEVARAALLELLAAIESR